MFRCFGSFNLIFQHVTKDHFEAVDEASIACEWTDCDALRRQRWSFMTHLQVHLPFYDFSFLSCLSCQTNCFWQSIFKMKSDCCLCLRSDTWMRPVWGQLQRDATTSSSSSGRGAVGHRPLWCLPVPQQLLCILRMLPFRPFDGSTRGLHSQNCPYVKLFVWSEILLECF